MLSLPFPQFLVFLGLVAFAQAAVKYLVSFTTSFDRVLNSRVCFPNFHSDIVLTFPSFRALPWLAETLGVISM